MNSRLAMSITFIFIITSCVFIGCAPTVSYEEYQNLQTQIKEIEEELSQTQSELAMLQEKMARAKAYIDVYDRLLDLSRVERGLTPIHGFYVEGKLTLSSDLDVRIKHLEDEELNHLWQKLIVTEIEPERIEYIDQMLVRALTGGICSIMCGCQCLPAQREAWEPPQFYHEQMIQVIIE